MFISAQRSVHFGPSAGSGPREVVDTFFFPRPIREIVAGLAGYSVSFAGSAAGRPFGRLVVDVGAAEFTGRQGRVACRFGLRDWSGTWDDDYTGVIDYVVRAELEDDDEPFGEEVTIRGVEWTQAIQFFRSHLDLDPVTRQPDNVIPLIAGKPTAIRIYADFNPPTGRIDAFDEYEGELEVRASGHTESITGLAPQSNLLPHRDTPEAPVAKSDVPHFLIPAELCTGDVTIRGRLRVANRDGGPSSDWSPLFERRLRFFEAQGVSVKLVGLEAVGESAPARPPTREEAEALFGRMRTIFPRGELTFSGFDVQPIVVSDSEAIRVLLWDMKGDSRDVHFALFSADFKGTLSGTEGMGIAGEAWAEDQVAWSEADQTTVAHEFGHLFGREHVFTGHGETGPFYDVLPTYGSYPRGSIGQHGVDTTTNQILHPAQYADVMTYKTWTWISASAYAALLPVIDDPFEQHVTGPPEAHGSTLFLSLTIGRNRHVVRHPSFHYPAPARRAPVARSRFTIELTDDCRHALVCWPLSTGLAPAYCWPKTYTAEMPFPQGAQWLLVWEDDRLIHEECIPSPPRLDLSCTSTSAGVQLAWAAEPADDLWFLVQWRDVDGTWRGLPPRTRETHALIPAALFREEAAVRVLATSGIATAAAGCSVALPRRRRDYSIGVTELSYPERRSPGGRVVGWRAFAYDEVGRSLSRAAFRWFDEVGREVHAGATLPAEALADATRQITLVVRDRYGVGGPVRRTWDVRGEGTERRLEEGTPCR